LFQNPVGFGQALGKTGQKPGFSPKSKEAVPKTEVLEQPHLFTTFGNSQAPCRQFFGRKVLNF
ncbi:MAG: hypothetical protein LBK05_10965, partial [Treponema sp.]|nr:hypothetical protein [Treponema sp.]